MPPRATLEAGDLVKPSVFARAAGIDPVLMRKWIQRSESILGRKVEPLGTLGPYETYDWNDLAALEREMHRRKQEREATAQAA